MVIQVTEMVLPVLVMLLLGCWCHRSGVFNDQGLAGIKSVIGNVLLPVVLFNAFFTAHYSLDTVILFVVIYCGFGLALLAGFGLRRFVSPYGRFLPVLLTSAEGGMLGYALYGLLTGDQSGFAAVDLGQTVFAYTGFMAALKATDGKSLRPAEMVKTMFTNRCFDGMLLGIVLGALGVGELVAANPLGGLVTKTIAMITSPVGALVLLVVGYELNLSRKLLKPVLLTALFRVVLMGALLALVSWVVFMLVPFSKELMLALMVLYALPAPFIIPLFADVGDDGDYISTSLSVETICTMILFAGIAAYAVA